MRASATIIGLVAGMGAVLRRARSLRSRREDVVVKNARPDGRASRITLVVGMSAV
jgi:hypothetical protein